LDDVDRDYPGHPGIYWGIFANVTLHTDSNPILPNLRALIWKDTDKESFPCLDLFFCPNLTALETYLLESSEGQICPSESHLLYLKETSPHLHYLSFILSGAMDKRHTDLQDAMSQLVSGLNRLESLRCPIPLSHDTLIHLSKLPIFELFDIPVDNIWQPLSVPASGFESLESLSISGDMICCTVFMRSFCFTQLKHLKIIHTTQTPSAVTVGTLFAALKSVCGHAAMTSLAIRFSPRQVEDVLPSDGDGDALSLCQLRDLFPFSNMEQVSISLPLDGTNAMIAELAMAWRRLRYLYILPPVSNRGRLGTDEFRSITLEGVACLAISCPDLAFLSLSVHASQQDVLARNDRSLCNLSFTTLAVVESSHDDDVDAAAVASFLCHLFPHLYDIHVIGQYTNDGRSGQVKSEWWELVRTTVENLQWSKILKIKERKRLINCPSFSFQTDQCMY
jgi:hypothetical protein